MLRKNRRNSYRLSSWDYGGDGYYFVTICTYQRRLMFGEIRDGFMCLNEFGRIVIQELVNTSKMRKDVFIDEFVIMPNHIHAIIIIRRGGLQPPTGKRCMVNGRLQTAPTSNISHVIQGIKSASTKKIHKTNPHFKWQRSFHDHIIRTENDLLYIKKYTKENPLKWYLDKNYPRNTSL